MVSSKNQALDTWTLLQVSQVHPAFEYVGDSAGLKTFKKLVLTIMYPHFALFSDMSIGHRISSHGQISDPLQNSQVVQIELRSGYFSPFSCANICSRAVWSGATLGVDSGTVASNSRNFSVFPIAGGKCADKIAFGAI